jgi:hypothetical protein
MEQKNTPWYKSRRFWGLALTAVSVFAPKYQPIAEVLPTLLDQTGIISGLLLSLYGGVKAQGPISF